MANIKSFPNNQDVFIGAEDVMKWHHGRTSGVFGADKNAAVSALADSTMEVQVSDGFGWIANASGDGIVWWNDHEKVNGIKLKLAVDQADGVLNRIDRIIVEWKTTDYTDLPEIKVLKGSLASNPTAPALTNNSTIRQISLARVYVAAGTTAITASMITDERLDDSVCGIVTENVSVDTSMANAQFNELINLIKKNLEQLVSGEIPDKSITREKFADNSIHTEEIVTLTPDGWVDNKQTVNVNDATAENLVLVAPGTDSYTAYAEAGIRCTEQNEGILIFECESVPDIDVFVNVTCFVDGEGGEGEGGGGGGGSVANAVLYTEQTLTEEQKAQARENIGAVTLGDVMNALPVWTGGSY